MSERKKSEVEEKAERDAAALRACVDSVLRTPEGKRLFAHLYRWCGQGVSSLVRDRTTGGVDTLTTAMNESSRAVYLHLAGLATRELILAAEDLAYEKAQAKPQPQEEERKN